MSLQQKLPEVPLEPSMSPQTRRFLVEVRKQLEALKGATAGPGLPANLVVTPQAFGNIVQWSRGVNADFHEVLWNTQPTVINAHVIPVQNGAQWTDNVGQVGIQRWYWVRAVKQVGLHSTTRTVEVGPGTGTTLAAATGVAPPTPPPSGVIQVINTRTGGREPL
jgi:hypothetical protein